MNNINANSRFSIHPDIAYTLIDDEAVLLGGMDQELYGLNDVGTEILKCLESNKVMSVQSLAEYLAQHFEVENDQAMQDTTAFLESMLSGQFIIEVNQA